MNRLKTNFIIHKDDNHKVGLFLGKNQLNVVIPKGMEYYEEAHIDILSKVLSKYHSKKHQDNVIDNDMHNMKVSDSTGISLSLLFDIIERYKVDRYYSRKEKQYSKSKGKKIDFKKTMKKYTPFLHEDQYIYNSYIKKYKTDENHVVKNIHINCIKEICEYLEIFYNNLAIEKNSKIYISKEESIEALKRELQNCYNDNDIRTLSNLIVYLENKGLNNHKFKYFKYSKSFEYIWEDMVDCIFSNINKKEFYYRSYWEIQGQSKLKKNKSARLDCIRIVKNKEELDIYIIDAKYYSYNHKSNEGKLPTTIDINKQIEYKYYVKDLIENKMEYLDKYKKINYYNIFILPRTTNDILEYFGKAYSEMDENEYIYGLYLDVDFAMNSYLGNKNTKLAIDKLKLLLNTLQ